MDAFVGQVDVLRRVAVAMVGLWLGVFKAFWRFRDEEVELREPEAILEEIAALDAESATILDNVKELVGQ